MGLHRPTLWLAALTLALAGCNRKPPVTPDKPGDVQPVVEAAVDPEVKKVQDELDQNWTQANRAIWYERTQGSRLMPLSWLYALEDDAGQPLFSEANIKRWGYLPRVNSKGRALPLGFTEDMTPDVRLPKPVLTWRKTPTADDRIWVGMNCSACHTAQMTYGGKVITVDGGPALSDFEGFLGEVTKALYATEKDDARFGRFADRVLGDKPLESWTPSGGAQAAVDKVRDIFTPESDTEKADRALLRTALGKVAARERELGRLNASTGKSDYGRLDAFGHIFNKVAYTVKARNQAPNPSDAPVSYPFLWNVPQHDIVQWNGIAPNQRIIQGKNVGPLARNSGEVIGVFGDIAVPDGGSGLGYPSSLNVAGLNDLEGQLTTLRPPKWPASILGWNEIKDAGGAVTADHDKLVADGRKLFGEPGGKGRCIACHQTIDRTDLKTPIKAQMALFNNKTPLGPNMHRSSETDIWMACNAYTRTAATGLMAGAHVENGGRLATQATLAAMLKAMVIRGLVGQGESALTAEAPIMLLPRPPAAILNLLAPKPVPPSTLTPEQRCLTEVHPILGYKGRPLNGIWATAPYLHNGSVRTLYQLLLPPEQREASFAVGSREFDPKEVGYKNSTDGPHSVLTAVAGGQPVRANSNLGHDYGNGKLTDYDRWALIEYMKTL